jgi:hypothetical protein
MEFRIEAVRIVLGYRSATITKVHPERHRHQTIEAIMMVG